MSSAVAVSFGSRCRGAAFGRNRLLKRRGLRFELGGRFSPHRTHAAESSGLRGLVGGGAAFPKPRVRGGSGDRCARSVWLWVSGELVVSSSPVASSGISAEVVRGLEVYCSRRRDQQCHSCAVCMDYA